MFNRLFINFDFWDLIDKKKKQDKVLSNLESKFLFKIFHDFYGRQNSKRRDLVGNANHFFFYTGVEDNYRKNSQMQFDAIKKFVITNIVNDPTVFKHDFELVKIKLGSKGQQFSILSVLYIHQVKVKITINTGSKNFDQTYLYYLFPIKIKDLHQ